MAVSKLNHLSFFSCHLQTPHHHLPTKVNCPLLSFKNPSLKIQLKTTIKEEQNPSSLSVIFPSLAFSNALFFNSPYNVQVFVGENEPEDALIDRFRRQVLRARVIQESKRRKFFEDSREKRKRKTRDAARRYRKKRPPPKATKQVKAADTSKKKKQEDSDDDNWEFLDIDLPYCRPTQSAGRNWHLLLKEMQH